MISTHWKKYSSNWNILPGSLEHQKNMWNHHLVDVHVNASVTKTRISQRPSVVFWSQSLKAGASRHVFLAHLAASIRFVDNLQHLMTWRRWRVEKRYDMWYLVEFECTLGLDVFDFCVKMKVSLLKTKGDWKGLSNISNCSIYRKQTSLESLSNGWDISSWMFVICSNSAVDTMYIIYTHCVISATKEGTGKASKGGLPQQTDHDLASCTQYVGRHQDCERCLVADPYKPSFDTTGGRSQPEVTSRSSASIHSVEKGFHECQWDQWVNPSDKKYDVHSLIFPNTWSGWTFPPKKIS